MFRNIAHTIPRNPGLPGLLFMVILLLAACTHNSLDDINRLKEKEKQPLLTGVDVVIEYTDSATLKARLNTPLMREFPRPYNYTELPNGVYIEFYNRSGSVTSRMKSRYAIHDKNKDLMEARQDVVVINENGEKLNTEKLVWDNTNRTLETDAFVKITKKEEILIGEGLEANESFTRYKILRPQGSFRVENAPAMP